MPALAGLLDGFSTPEGSCTLRGTFAHDLAALALVFRSLLPVVAEHAELLLTFKS
jgi:hypothetical protein